MISQSCRRNYEISKKKQKPLLTQEDTGTNGLVNIEKQWFAVVTTMILILYWCTTLDTLFVTIKKYDMLNYYKYAGDFISL